MATAPRKRPCRFCRKWFVADPRVGESQYACGAQACQFARQRANEAAWLERHPGYFGGRAQRHRAWRRAHPGRQRERRAADPALREREREARRRRRLDAASRRAVEQKARALQLLPEQGLGGGVEGAVEQKSWRAQVLVLLGVAAGLPPAVEPKPMASSLQAWHALGLRLAGGQGGWHPRLSQACPDALAHPADP